VKRIRTLTLAFLLLSGCAIGSSYHDSDNLWKLGYSDIQMNDRVYRVSYAGYSIPQNECDDFALMRASEITREKGYRYFRILAEKQSSQSQAFYIPGSTTTVGTISGYGNVTRFNATSYSSGLMATVSYPVSTITIELLKENNGTTDTLDAEIIWNALEGKNGLVNKSQSKQTMDSSH
jgi:hypothetical protein